MFPRLLILFFLSFAYSPADQLTGSDPSTPPEVTRTEEADEASDPLIKAADIIQIREQKTIGASVKKKTAEDDDVSETLESLQAALSAEQDFSDLDQAESSTQRLQEIVIAFVFEFAFTLIVLSIAFQISASSAHLRQLISISLAVALIGAILHTLVAAAPLHPVRAFAGLFILAVLLRQFTEVRSWTSALKIALITRLISLALIWLMTIALASLGSL